uniref:Ribonuclease H-like domain-containing protein n=1 Tax=Tanacetum cinerariifolium TaxID=118510 RepID=A0A699QVU5_TANCI|nr:ribonuclease H-like domain-containing protein [Tanacetum cinerariifolium]
MKRIKREFSVARTSQQNGVAEGKNRTLIEAARTMLADSLNQPIDNAGIKENIDADPQNIDAHVADAAFNVKESEKDVHVFTSGSDKTENKKHDDKAKRDDKGKSPVDLSIRVRDLRAEFEEFSSNTTNRVNAVSAPVNAFG